jgi:hypothetical protein
VLDATLLYSNCTVSNRASDKLTFVFSSLESVFIQNNTESIQTNLSERIAFAIENSAERRKATIVAIKEAYGLRSRFLHHGASIDNMEQAEKLFAIAWRAIIWLAAHVAQFKTVDSMLQELERRKLS